LRLRFKPGEAKLKADLTPEKRLIYVLILSQWQELKPKSQNPKFAALLFAINV